MIENAWLKALKVGDEVVVEGGGAMRNKSISRVEKVTRAHGGTVVVDGEPYDMAWGTRRGRRGDYFPPRIGEATPEARDEIRRVKLLGYIETKLDRDHSHALPTTALEQIAVILRDAATKESDRHG